MILWNMFRKFLRVAFAKYHLAKMKESLNVRMVLNKGIARKWNHLQAILITGGEIKIDWDKLRGIERPRCHRCLKPLSENEVKHCPECKKIINS